MLYLEEDEQTIEEVDAIPEEAEKSQPMEK